LGRAKLGFDVRDRAWLVVAFSVCLEDTMRWCGVGMKVVQLVEGKLVSGEGRQRGSARRSHVRARTRTGMGQKLGVAVWRVWSERKSDAEWAADLERVLEGQREASKAEALKMTVRRG
jgi:hypothetical protein